MFLLACDYDIDYALGQVLIIISGGFYADSQGISFKSNLPLFGSPGWECKVGRGFARPQS